MEKLFFYDTETTGVQFWRNGIHQIAYAIVIDGILKERHNLKVRPHINAIIEDEALKVGNVTREQIMAYPVMDLAYQQIVKTVNKYVDKYNRQDKLHLAGYNIGSFDNPFFRAFFVQNNDKYFGSLFWSDSIDVMVLASNKLKEVRHTMANFKQATVAKQLGIEVDETKLHDADYDLDVCMAIYNKVK